MLRHCAVLLCPALCLLSLVGCGGGEPASSTAAPERPLSVELNAFVDFQEGQIVVKNRDGFDWVNVRMEINPGIVRGGWKCEAARIPAGSTYRAGAMTFTKGQGERFNPFTHQVEKFAIHCDTSPDHGRGNWFGGY